MVTIRTARVEDATVLAAAERETARTPGYLVSRPHELRPEAFAAKIAAVASSGRYVVAEEGGRIVGHAILEPMSLEAIAHVYRLTIVVHPGQTRRGYGAEIMKDLLSWAAPNPKVGKIELLVRAVNAAAIALYRNCGFVEEGRFKGHVRLEDGTFIDDLAMAWFPPNRKS
jgi:RimJ/RimL family protein N-acetyltransferase